jgi:hypothetical protein
LKPPLSSPRTLRPAGSSLTDAGSATPVSFPVSSATITMQIFHLTHGLAETALDHFRESLAAKQNDPYAVVLKQNKLPMSLLQESTKNTRPDLVSAEPFAQTFGPRSQRKRPKVEAANFEDLIKSNAQASTSMVTLDSELPVEEPAAPDGMAEDEARYKAAEDAEAESRNAPVDYILSAGTSRRIWGELYKVRSAPPFTDLLTHKTGHRLVRCHPARPGCPRSYRHTLRLSRKVPREGKATQEAGLHPEQGRLGARMGGCECHLTSLFIVSPSFPLPICRMA